MLKESISTRTSSKRIEKFKKHVALKSSSVELKNEFAVYSDEPLIVDQLGFDILEWWRHIGIRFPVIQCLARDIFSIPLSTVASESVFSTGGRVLDKYCSSMIPSKLEAIVCSQDLLKSELRGSLVCIL